MATSTTALVTVEELRQMVDPPGFRLELHGGEVVAVSRPNMKHAIIQKRIAQMLDAVWGDKGWAATEVSFRVRPEHELRVADVGWISKPRFDRISRTDNLYGSPEFVVEVLSPSNRAGELLEKKHLCFSSGCEEFWIVDAERLIIEVTKADSTVHVYQQGQYIPIGSSNFSVDDILSD